MDVSDVLFKEIPGKKGKIGEIILNRPKALNALSLEMCAAIDQQLQRWQEEVHIKAVVIRSEHPKAFCAGGDIRYLYELGKENPEKAAEFTAVEYRMNQRIHDFPKPYIAFMDGITMGGGAGVSIHGSHRIVSEFSLFAMPETGIGFFPDVGASYFLPRCPGEIGLFLALTGARLQAADMLYAKLADHYIERAQHAATIELLAAADLSTHANQGVTEILQHKTSNAGVAPLAKERAFIDHYFIAKNCQMLLDKLAAGEDSWSQEVLTTLKSKSPLSLAVTFEQMRHAAMWLSFDACMQMEYKISQQFFKTTDFYEGVRAVVIDKDQKPIWPIQDLAQINAEMLSLFF